MNNGGGGCAERKTVNEKRKTVDKQKRRGDAPF
jgi:hypothetical protein